MSSTKHWQRFNPDATTGHINWPTASAGWNNTEEGGMTVYAIWDPIHNPAHVCSPGLLIEASAAETYVGATGPNASDYDYGLVRAGFPTDAIVMLGATGGSWADNNDRFFVASMDDVTPDGRVILDALSHIYGCEPTLLTFLDT